MAADPEPVGMLVVRAWVEGSTRGGLRAVIRRTPDLAREDERVTHAGTVPDVLAAVEAWLEELLADRLGDGRDSAGGPAG